MDYFQDDLAVKRSIDSNKDKPKQTNDVIVEPKNENKDNNSKKSTQLDVKLPIPSENNDESDHKIEESNKNVVHDSESNEESNNNSESVNAKFDQPINSPYSCLTNTIPMKRMGKAEDGSLEFSFKFKVFITDPKYEGLYSLHFHNCLNYQKTIQELNQYTSVDFDIKIVEKNLDNYLSAGKIPLPQLFFALSIIFFIMGTIWFVSIRSRYEETFKIHYLMGVLVFVKALSLLFHSINYHFIAKEGSQVETWAVLYYITHFLKGALLFITIVLIGTGWAFIKHILNDKDKKIFMVVIPLQVIANIADIITEESEEGALIHTVWREIFILVDMICCGAILFPVIWSIRHLHEASATDGKAAINLKKLQLFRFFYVMIVFYIYFTRIIVYLVKITVPFNYEWLAQFFQHSATLIFFILTGYHFQPITSNPYYQLLQDEIEMDEEVYVFVYIFLVIIINDYHLFSFPKK
ncbi:seven transmembrane receptor-like protein [Euroglyphus maynei]|uniref:Seven transmembrane receptor-like protein n=1 Tax=Euroglyphus maynei TaxID=6958 RepID=A0A1Y3BRE0_EURMA|nr:seven transmembrane receptor-like protein [Euroglyphus maynei]